jgi:predicted Fe-Mo cluster-binding NifX family protein
VKIAAVTEDGVTISQHFGRAPYYVVLTVEDGQIVHREQREKVAHGRGHSHDHSTHVHLEGEPHGFDPAAQDTHSRMAAPITDCDVLLARGMGGGAYAGLKQAGIRPILTTVSNIEEAALQAANGTIVDHPERLH